MNLQEQIDKIRPSLKGLSGAVMVQMDITFPTYTNILNGRIKNEETLTNFLRAAKVALTNQALAKKEMADSISVSQ